MDNLEEKTCNVCELTRPSTDFYPRQGRCKQCHINIGKKKMSREDAAVATRASLAPVVPTKACADCGEEKPETEEYFRKHPRWDMLIKSCRECQKTVQAQAAQKRVANMRAKAEAAAALPPPPPPVLASAAYGVRICSQCGVAKDALGEYPEGMKTTICTECLDAAPSYDPASANDFNPLTCDPIPGDFNGPHGPLPAPVPTAHSKSEYKRLLAQGARVNPPPVRPEAPPRPLVAAPAPGGSRESAIMWLASQLTEERARTASLEKDLLDYIEALESEEKRNEALTKSVDTLRDDLELANLEIEDLKKRLEAASSEAARASDFAGGLTPEEQAVLDSLQWPGAR